MINSKWGGTPLVTSALIGLVVKASAWRVDDPGFRIFSRLSHTSDLKIGTQVATLSGTWHYRVSAGTGQPGVSILWLGEVESLICNVCLSVAASKIVQIRPWDTLACCWDVSNQQTPHGCPWSNPIMTMYMHTAAVTGLSCHKWRSVDHSPTILTWLSPLWLFFPSVKRRLKGKQLQSAGDARAFFEGVILDQLT